MRVAVDTNILVRAVVGDDEAQARSAAKLLRDAATIAVSSTALCELVWVLGRFYKLDKPTRALAIRALVAAANVAIDRPAVDAGLTVLDAGGDFADGVIAHEAAKLGGETFVSFDKRAVALVAKLGRKAELVGSD